MTADGSATQHVPAVALLPARGGSKRVPRKNIRLFHGKPLITWTIEALKRSSVDEIVVSTDDDEIADIAKKAGALVPFRRPAELADDFTGTGEVVRHALGELQTQGWRIDELCLTYPAAVFVDSKDFDEALSLLRTTPADFVFSVTTFAAPIERALALSDDGYTSMRSPEHLLTRSQDLPDHYYDAGQFYWGRADAWSAAKPVMQSRSIGYRLPRELVEDIDTEEDWRRAELIFAMGAFDS